MLRALIISIASFTLIGLVAWAVNDAALVRDWWAYQEAGIAFAAAHWPWSVASGATLGVWWSAVRGKW